MGALDGGNMSQNLKNELESSILTADTDMLEDSFLQNIGVNKQNLNMPGPGSYNVKHVDDIFKLKKGSDTSGTFTKDERFRLAREEQDKVLDKKLKLKPEKSQLRKVKYGLVKPRIKGGAALHKPVNTIENNSKLAKKYKVQQSEEVKRAEFELENLKKQQLAKKQKMDRLKEKSEAARLLDLKKLKLQKLLDPQNKSEDDLTSSKISLNNKERIFQMFRLMDVLDGMRLGPGTYNAFEYDQEPEDEKLNARGLKVKKQRKFYSKDDSCMVDYTRDLKETIPRPRK